MTEEHSERFINSSFVASSRSHDLNSAVVLHEVAFILTVSPRRSAREVEVMNSPRSALAQ